MLKLFFVTLIFITTIKASDVLYFDIIGNIHTIKFLESLINLNTTTQCRNHLQQYMNDLQLGKTWALAMFDSSAKVPNGILEGNNKYLGHFDECLKTQHPEKLFLGRHCMINIDLSFDEKPLDSINSRKIKKLNLFYGLCLPSTCGETEIENGLRIYFNATLLRNITTVRLKEGNCRTSQTQKISSGDWAAAGVLIAYGAIILICTSYDIVKQYTGTRVVLLPYVILSSFSLYSNWKKLFKINQNYDQIKCIYGLRFLSICWVVLQHSFFLNFHGPVVNPLDQLEKTENANYVIITHAYIAVETFFFISGFLVCVVFFRNLRKKGYHDSALGYIRRYFRLTPSLAAMMLIQATVIPHIGNGPFWNLFCEESAKICKENWWEGLLYVQNFVTPHSTCLPQSWYLAADMQLYWLSPFILYSLLISPIFASIFLALLILGAAFLTFTVVYLNDLGPSPLITKPELRNKQYELEYLPFYTRATPWLIGLATGYILLKLQLKKIQIKLTTVWAIFGWVISAALCLGSLYGIMSFTDYKYTATEAAFYLAFHRIGWSLGLAWIVLACVQNYGGPINRFLSSVIFQPLGKLSYNIYLIHMTLQMYRLGKSRTNYYSGDFEYTYYILGDLVLTILVAIPFTLIFELPFANFDNYILQHLKILPLPRPK